MIHIILAQGTASNEGTLTTVGLAGILTIVIGGIRSFMSDRAKTKRDDEQTNVLRDISRTNNDIRLGQVDQNGKLAKVAEINKIYHDEVIRTMTDIPCRELRNKTTTKTIDP